MHVACAGDPQAVGGKYGVSMLAPTAFTFFADLLAQYEGAGHGATWADAWADPFPIGAVLMLLVADTALYGTAQDGLSSTHMSDPMSAQN